MTVATAERSERSREAQRERYRLREVAWELSSRPSIRACGRGRRAEAVEVVQGEHGARYRGLMRCASIWACPVCSARIRQERAEDIGLAVKRHRERGGRVWLVSLTLPHDFEDDLGELWETVAKGWRRCLSGQGWRVRLGVVGTIRSTEVTYGRSGWHPHVHALVFTGRAGCEAGSVRAHFASRWRGAVEADGWRAPHETYGVDVVEVGSDDGIAGYVAGLELARGDLKRGRWRGSLTPFQVLECAGYGQAWALGVWWAWERGSAGRRGIGWSRGLRELLGLRREREDHEVIADADEQGDEVVAVIGAREWASITAVRGRAWQLLYAAEVGGAEGVAVVRLRWRRREKAPPRAAGPPREMAGAV